jgi:hypothetical protein
MRAHVRYGLTEVSVQIATMAATTPRKRHKTRQRLKT